jgi:hypothetical protein
LEDIQETTKLESASLQENDSNITQSMAHTVGEDEQGLVGGSDTIVEAEHSFERKSDAMTYGGPTVAVSNPEHSPSSPSSASETGSLPLEDPEDEDADPDWLVNAT